MAQSKARQPIQRGVILPPGKLVPADGDFLESRLQPEIPEEYRVQSPGTSTSGTSESKVDPSPAVVEEVVIPPLLPPLKESLSPSLPVPSISTTAAITPSFLMVKRLHPEVPLPSKPFSTSAGWDIAYWEKTESGRLSRAQIGPHSASRPLGTGLVVVPPAGHVILVLSRSGLAVQGLFVANAPGLVDPDYTGELKIILYNGSYQAKNFATGDRIAQLLIVPIHLANFVEVTTLPASGARGVAGFGSSGL